MKKRRRKKKMKKRRRKIQSRCEYVMANTATTAMIMRITSADVEVFTSFSVFRVRSFVQVEH
jgi:hypothetical protein